MNRRSLRIYIFSALIGSLAMSLMLSFAATPELPSADIYQGAEARR